MRALALGLVFTLLLLLPMPTRAPAQALHAPDIPEFEQKTGLPNGRMWLKMADGERETWLMGFSNGVFVVEALAHPSGAAANATPLEKFLSSAYESNLTIGEKAQAVTHFYQDTPENAPITLPAALEYVTIKANGATQSQLDDFFERPS